MIKLYIIIAVLSIISLSQHYTIKLQELEIKEMKKNQQTMLLFAVEEIKKISTELVDCRGK